MESRWKLAGHAVHPMLVVFPLGLLPAAVLFDLIRMIHGGSGWGEAAFYDIAVGVAGGLVAAVFGFVDWLGLPNGTRAKAVGMWHGGGNVVIVVMFVISWFLRLPNPGSPPVAAFVLAVAGVLLALVTAWLGGELVERLRVGVDDNAFLDAPSSLSEDKIRRRRQVE